MFRSLTRTGMNPLPEPWVHVVSFSGLWAGLTPVWNPGFAACCLVVGFGDA
jgi:hypothetical protein